MATYRNVQMSFWTDSKVMDDFTPEDKLFFLYIMTNPLTSLCGCYECSKKRMSRDTGYSVETITNIIYRMENIHHVVMYNDETKEVLILNWDKYNWTQSSKVLDGAYKGAIQIKAAEFKDYVLRKLQSYGYEIDEDLLSEIPYAYPMDKTVTVTVTDNSNVNNSINNNNTKEKEEQEFNQFWEEYPNHKGKKDAAKAFKRVIEKKETDFETMINAIHVQKKSYDWQKDNGRFVPMASTWLNGARWNDEFKPNPVAKTKPKNTLSQEMTHDYDLDELRRRAKE